MVAIVNKLDRGITNHEEVPFIISYDLLMMFCCKII